MPTNSRLCPTRVCSVRVCGSFSFTVARDAVRAQDVFLCLYIYERGEREWPADFFSKAIVTPACGPRKKPNHPNPSAAHTKSHQVTVL